MKKKIILALIPIVIVIGVAAVLGIICYNETKVVNSFLNKETISSVLDQVNRQVEINNKLETISKEKKYTFNDAYVELNPYEISPLSAVIIFRTNKASKVDVYINDKKVTTTEETSNHIIPIYGLYEDFENKVKLVMNGEEAFYNIKTEKSNLNYTLNVEHRSEKLNDEEMYFTVASYETYVTAWDNTGKLRFYLTVNIRMDIEWLDNGHFLLGTAQGQFAENFCAFVEMDYLGKIYNYYVPENGYSFEFQTLKNGNYMLAGGNNPVYVKEQVVYELNPKTGEKVSEINLAEIVRKIDPDFGEVYLGQKAIRNAFAYNEDTKELLMSFRGWDAVVSFNYETKTLNWVFTDPENDLFNKDVWKDYLVKLEKGRYPLGQHSVIFTSDGNIGFFNNGYNRLHGFENGGNNEVSYYTENYSSGEVYKIENKKAKLVFSYDNQQDLFSHQYGSFKEYDNNSYLIDFGYTLHDDYKLSDKGTLAEAENSPDNIYAKIVEITKDGDILFEATSEEGKFRAFKHSLYNSKTDNVNVKELNIFNKVKEEPVTESNYKNYKLDVASEWIYTLDFTQNTFTTNYEIKEDDEIKFLFVNKVGKVYEVTYKAKDNTQLQRIFNINLPNGDYAMYIEVNGSIYNTLKNYSFKK